jgi:uncharacterized protein (DUF2141 family)
MLCAIFLSGALLLPARAEDLAMLTVKVDHVSSRGGNLRLAIYDAKSFADDNAKPVADRVVPAVPYSVSVSFAPLPPGTYAIKMFQDANKNEKFDFDWLGIPAERYGFSNNARPDWIHLSPPGFDAAKVELKPGANWTEIWLH